MAVPNYFKSLMSKNQVCNDLGTIRKPAHIFFDMDLLGPQNNWFLKDFQWIFEKFSDSSTSRSTKKWKWSQKIVKKMFLGVPGARNSQGCLLWCFSAKIKKQKFCVFFKKFWTHFGVFQWNSWQNFMDFWWFSLFFPNFRRLVLRD